MVKRWVTISSSGTLWSNTNFSMSQYMGSGSTKEPISVNWRPMIWTGLMVLPLLPMPTKTARPPSRSDSTAPFCPAGLPEVS